MTPLTLQNALRMAPVRNHDTSSGSSPFDKGSATLLKYMLDSKYFWCTSCNSWVPLENRYGNFHVCKECY